MKTKIIVGVVILAVLSVSYYWWQERRENESVPWIGQELFTIPYGNGKGHVAASLSPRVAPTSFALDNGTILISDIGNDRILRFDEKGELKQEIGPVRAIDILVDTEHNIWALDGSVSKVIKFGPDGKKLREEPQTKAQISKLVFDLSGKVTEGTLPEGFVVKKLDNHNGEFLDTERKLKIKVATYEDFGSIDFLGRDKRGNYYLQIEDLPATPDGTIKVNTYVKRYSKNGKETASLLVTDNSDYFSPAAKSVVLSPDGTIYQMSFPKDSLVITKWFAITR